MPSKTPPQLVVPHPIPDDPLQRVVVPTIEQVEYPRGVVPGRAVTVSGDPGEAPVEMVEGNPSPPITKAPVFIPRVEEWPVHLTAQVLLQPGKNGSPNIQSLRAPANAWMRVDEIKFEVLVLESDNTDLTFATWTAEGFGAVIGASLTLKGRPLTSGFVPLSMFGPAKKLVHERQIFITSPNSVNTQCRAEQYTWPLAVPVYVPPGTILEPVFEHKGYVNYNVRARVSYAGALVKNPPSPVDVGRLPFASAWLGQTIDLIDYSGPKMAQTEPPIFSSEESALVGPKGSEFHVEALMGRMYMRLQTADYFALIESDFDTAGPFPPGSYLSQYTQAVDLFGMRAIASWDAPIVEHFVPWWAFFDRVSRQTVVPFTLPADAFVTVEVRAPERYVLNNAAMLPLVSLVGWQEVAP